MWRDGETPRMFTPGFSVVRLFGRGRETSLISRQFGLAVTADNRNGLFAPAYDWPEALAQDRGTIEARANGNSGRSSPEGWRSLPRSNSFRRSK
jgi:hypothetical protein